MRWSKIKNVIILLLLIVNVALLVMVGVQRLQSSRNERETRERMVALMEKNDVTYLPEEIPGSLELSTLRLTLDVPDEAEAALLLGELSSTETVGTHTVYAGTGGTVSVSSSGELEGNFQPAFFSARTDDPRFHVEDALDDLRYLGLSVSDDHGFSGLVGDSCTYTQLWDGVPVPDCPVTLTWQNGSLTGLRFRRLAGTAETVTTGGTIDASTALARFLEALKREGYVCSRVDDVYPGYALSGASTAVTLTPSWYISTDAGLFAVDGYTGVVSAAG